MFLLLLALSDAAVKLPAYNVNVKGTSAVTGLSSGAYMAVQMQVAFSSYFVGAGIFAGGPYDCAEGSIAIAEDTCMYALGLTPSKYISTTKDRAGSGQIDDYNNLASHRIYMFSGTKDTTVEQPVMDALQTYYQAFMPASNILYKNDLVAAHTQPTDDSVNKNPCTLSATPYLSNCNYDGAGIAMNQMFGTLLPRNNGTLTGDYIEYDQTEFTGTGNSMDSTGWAFVPKACSAGQSCRLMIAFHGCLQGQQAVGMSYIQNTGYNKWADTNNIIVLYPQAVKQGTANPNGCWDWWGYLSDAKTYDTNTGPQMVAVKKMMDRIGSGASSLSPPSGLVVSAHTSNSASLSWSAVASAAGYNLYRNGTKVNPQVLTTTSYVDSGLASQSLYEYTVTSVSSTGSESAQSPAVSVITDGGGVAPPAPVGLSVAAVTGNSITLKWQAAAGATGYNIYRNGVITNSQPVVDISYTDTGLASDTVYSYQVTSVGNGLESTKSNTVMGETSTGYPCTTYQANNQAHVDAGRAMNSNGEAYAKGSSQDMGLCNTLTITTLAEISDGYYVLGNCPSL